MSLPMARSPGCVDGHRFAGIWGGALLRPETGGRYNPATDLAPFSNANAPSWRNGHNLVWTGTELIVCGWLGWLVYR